MAQWGGTGAGGGSGRRDRGAGEAAEGRIRASVLDERLESLQVEPRLLRTPADTLSGHIIDAVNAALADFRANRGSGQDMPDFDLNEVADDLRKKSEQFGLEMRRTMAEAAELTAELRRSGVTVGDLPTVEFDDLVDEVAEVLREVNGGRGDDEEELVGVGEAPHGLAHAECVPEARLVALEVNPRAMRGTVELQDNVVAAVNAALDDLAGKRRERQAESGVDPRLLKAKLDALRERNMARLESYLKALGDVVRGIGPA